MVSKAKKKKTEVEEERAKPRKNRRKAEVKKENADQKEKVSGIEERAGGKNEEMITMMNEDKKKEAQKRLTEEERVRRLREGGETMRAELTMEESERIAQLGTKGAGYSVSEEEQERRRITGTNEAYRGYGETQKAEMAMWGREAPSRRQMTQEEMRRTGSDQVNYPSGGGSYYTETFEKPTGSTGPESSFGRTERTPSGRQYAEGEPMPYRRNLTQDEMRRTGSDQTNYPAGGGSYYTETFERPTGSAGPESSFGRTERIPSGQQYAEREVMEGRMGVRPAPEPGPTSKAGQTAAAATVMMKEKGGQASGMVKEKGGQAMEKSKEYGATAVSKTKAVVASTTTKAKEYTEGGRAEDIAHRAGESLGKAIRKTVAVAREMTSGLRKGLSPEEKERERSMGAERGAEEMAPKTEVVEREEYARETPAGEERKYQEVRKKQNE